MHPTLKKAIDRANEILDEATVGDAVNKKRLEDLKAMPKKDLVALIAAHEGLHKTSTRVGETCAAILCDPDCSWLTYDMIHAILISRLPGTDTKPSNVAWYAAHYRNEMGRDIQLRKPKKEIDRLLLKSA